MKSGGIMKYKLIIIAFFFTISLVGCEPTVSIELIPGDDQINILEEYTPGACQITYNDEVYDMSIISNSLDNKVEGTYSIEYAIIINDETYSCTRKVFVTDEEGPIIVLNPGIDTIHLDEEWIDASITISDNYSSPENIQVIVIGEVLNQVGVYEITYQAIDEAGNSSFIKRVVSVIQ